MRRIVKWLLRLLLLLLVAAGGFALFVQVAGIPRYRAPTLDLHVEVTPVRVERGRRFASMLCAECHIDPSTRELTGKRLADLPTEFGPVFSRNITQDRQHGIGAWSDGELAVLLRTGIGRDGRYLPAYMPKFPALSDEDLASVIAFLRSGDKLVEARAKDPPGRSQPSFLTKLLTRTVMRPLPLPTAPIANPPAGDRLALGRYLARDALLCFACHSADFKTNNDLQPERSPGYFGGGNLMPNLDGRLIVTANLTPDPSGFGTWTEADFVRAMRTGFRPGADGATIGHRLMRYPMVPYPDLSDEELGAIYTYLRTLPVLPTRFAATPEPDYGGRSPSVLYHKYGCHGCHGENGVGLADLSRATAHYPSDEALTAWVRNAPKLKPGTKMPRFDGLIDEADYPPLLTHIRGLAKP